MPPSIIALLSIVGAVALFFVCRGLFCWYWKINKIVAFLESIDNKLRDANTKLSSLLGSMGQLSTNTTDMLKELDKPKTIVGKRKKPKSEVVEEPLAPAAEEALAVHCPFCNQEMEIDEAHMGTQQTCPSCQQSFQIGTAE